MARTGFSTSNYFRTVVTPPVVATPLTLVSWFNPNTLTPAASATMVVLDNSAAAANRNSFLLYMDTSGHPVAQAADGTATQSSGNGATAANLNAWNHAAAVFNGTTQLFSYLNGALGGSNTGGSVRVPSSLDSITIGASWDTGPAVTRPFTGDLAEAAVYNIALSAAEILALSKGLSPLKMRPEALVAYWPLVGNNSPENNLKSNAVTMSIVGSLSKSAHPRVILPKRGLLV